MGKIYIYPFLFFAPYATISLYFVLEALMIKAKRILPYTLTQAALALLEILLSAFVTPLLVKSATAAELFSLLFALFAVIPPFLALGMGTSLLRTHPISHALLPLIIFGGIDLFAEIPLSLIAFTTADSAPYGVLLASYMITSVVTTLLFVGVLVLGYALFLQGDKATSREGGIFSLSDAYARPVLLASALFTLYRVIREVIGMVEYARDRLFVISARDVLYMLLYLLFFLLLGVFSFAVGRISERIFPPLLLEDGEDTEEADDYEE